MSKLPKTIYALMGSYDYESDTIVALYASEANARTECARRQSHKAQEPRPGDGVSYEAWPDAFDKWREGLGGTSNYDSYYVVERELLP